MKKIALLSLLLLTYLAGRASEGFTVTFDQPSGGTYVLEFNIDDFSLSAVTHGGTTYTLIGFEQSTVTQKKGFAALPYVHASVMLDARKNVSLEWIPGDYDEYQLDYPLLPSRGVITRDQDPSTIPYIIDPRSVTDAWYPGPLAENTRPFILRDYRGTTVFAYPFQYNAAKNVLRVYRNFTVRLVENNSASINPLEYQNQTILREMDPIYREVFINYGISNRDALTIGEYGDILVLTTDRDVEAIQPYIQWKTEKGYYVTTQVVAPLTNVNTIVDAAYAANPNLLYVMLVGDWDDIRCDVSSINSPMDPQVGCVVGDDVLPDITVGRFSANSPADVTVQVDKSITYEKLPELAGTWYSAAIGVASDQGPGDDGEMDFGHNDVIYNDKLDPFTYDLYTDIYDPGATAAEVTAAVNAGASVINYTGHGWMEGWGTTGFSNGHVAGLTNGDKLPVIVSVACNNGDFHNGTCFAEAWLRKSGGGAVMFLGASISQPWDPPMRGQDYFMDVLIGGYDYAAHPGQNGISTTEQRTTTGAMIFNGLVLMCVEAGPGDYETAQTWNLFGDPALQVRTATPATLNLTNSLVMVGIPFSTTVTSGGSPVEGAMVALSQGDLMFRGITDSLGMVTIIHSLDPGPAKLVVTSFNSATIYQDVNVIPPDGPYVQVAGYVLEDAGGNGDGLLDYGEAADLLISLVNVGTEEATEVGAVLSTGDPYVTVDNDSVYYGNILPGDTITPEFVYPITAADSLPDLHSILFNLLATGNGDQEWPSNIFVTGHAPVLEYLSYSIDDASGNGNGMLDPGETVDMTITVMNSGSSEAVYVQGFLGTTCPYVSITDTMQLFGNIAAGDTVAAVYQVLASEDAPSGTTAVFDLSLTGLLGITGGATFNLCIGQIPVLLVDLDGNGNSPVAMATCFSNLSVAFDQADAVPEDMSIYTSVFVSLGTYSSNYILTADEGQRLADYLANGGRLYMEGADTWAYDPPTAVHPMFHINALSDGNGDLGTLLGQPGSIVDGMNFSFAGENSYIDQISAGADAVLMFNNESPSYGVAVSYDAGTYRTIGFTFEFGGITDGDLTKDDLMIEMLEFFGIEGDWVGIADQPPVGRFGVNVYPNPSEGLTHISFSLEKSGPVTLQIFDLQGRAIGTLFDGNLQAGQHLFSWDGPTGMYFFSLRAGGDSVTGKLIRY